MRRTLRSFPPAGVFADGLRPVLFRFDGRINRAKFWLAGLFILCLMMLLGILIITVGKLFGGPSSFSFGLGDIVAALDEIEMVPHKAGPPPVWRVKPGYE